MITKIDHDGLLLCKLQANTFALSREMTDSSSEIFIRRFMKSDISKNIDNRSLLQTTEQPKSIIESITKQYGKTHYGSVKYSSEELYWIGYFYRYFCYTYNLSSSQVYKIVKPRELRGVYPSYHSFDLTQAIERILESKHISFDEEAQLIRQYEIYRKIRQTEDKS